MENITSSLEDYLEVICNYTDNKADIRAIDISKKLKVSRASVTEALQKLAKKGYIIYDKHNSIQLTESGKSIASNIVQKHTFLQSFFENILGLNTDEANINACKIEHVITDNAFHKLVEYINGNKK